MFCVIASLSDSRAERFMSTLVNVYANRGMIVTPTTLNSPWCDVAYFVYLYVYLMNVYIPSGFFAFTKIVTHIKLFCICGSKKIAISQALFFIITQANILTTRPISALVCIVFYQRELIPFVSSISDWRIGCLSFDIVLPSPSLSRFRNFPLFSEAREGHISHHFELYQSGKFWNRPSKTANYHCNCRTWPLDGGNGLLLSPKYTQALSKVLIHIARRPDERELIALVELKVTEKNSITKKTNSWTNLFNHVADNSKQK